MKKKSASKKRGASRRNGVEKRKYARSTPIGRMLKRFIRAKESLDFSIDRMCSWTSDDRVLTAVLDASTKASSQLKICIDGADSLVEGGWSPPAKSLAVVFAKGDMVQIAQKYRKKYRSLYSLAVMNHLVVFDISESGEVVVKSEVSEGDEPPPKFFTAKSHLKRRSGKGADKETNGARV